MFLMIPFKASIPWVGTVRLMWLTAVVSALVLGVLCSAGLSLAANVDTFARVNLVEGMKATVGAASQENDARVPSGSLPELNISGPAHYCVEVQLSSLAIQSQWTDQVSQGGIKFDAHHDAQGHLNLDDSLDGLDAEESTVDSPRYIVTLTYE